MATETPQELIRWLDKKLEENGWSDNQLAKHAGLNSSTISRLRSGVAPGYDACVSIAKAFGVPRGTVLKLADLVEKEKDWGPEFDEWNSLFSDLGDDDKAEMLAIGRMKRGNDRKKKVKG